MAHQAEHPLAGTRMATDPISPDLAVALATAAMSRSASIATSSGWFEIAGQAVPTLCRRTLGVLDQVKAERGALRPARHGPQTWPQATR